MKDYSDIINIEHFEPKHKRMSIYKRSAEFSPFSALTGFDELVIETGRRVNKKIILNNDDRIEINNKLNLLINDKKKKIKITYFIKDTKKDGGEYKIDISYIKKINKIDKYLILENNTKIYFNNIFDINIMEEKDGTYYET